MSIAFQVVFAAVLALSSAPSAEPVGRSGPSVTSSVLLKTRTTWNGAPIAYTKSAHPEIQTVWVEVAPGAATAWHQHPVNNIAYIVEGRVRLELESGVTREFKAGESFAEVVNTWHRGVNVGAGTLKILVVYTGEAGRPISIPKPAEVGEKGE